MKSKVETYALTVCFASIVCLMISGGFAIYGLVQLIAPDLMMQSWNHTMLQSNDEYWEIQSRLARENEETQIRPPEAELTSRRERAYSLALSEERRDGFQLLMRALSFAAAGGVVLLLHWRLAQRFRSHAA